MGTITGLSGAAKPPTHQILWSLEKLELVGHGGGGGVVGHKERSITQMFRELDRFGCVPAKLLTRVDSLASISLAN
jgi:hypothetical protein